MTRLARWPEVGLFLILWLTLLAVGRTQMFGDPGTYWHVRVGQTILTDGQFFRHDPYTFTFHGKHWIPQQWAGECAMALADRLNGLDSLLLGAATLLAGFYAWLGGRLIRAGLHPLPACLLLALCLGASSFHFHIRPNLASIVFFGLTVALLIDCERQPSERWRWLWLLLPGFVVWANVHGGVLAGIATLGLVAVGWLMGWVVAQRGPLTSWAGAAGLLALLVGCLLSPLVNPFGLDMLDTWQRIMTSKALPELILEHRPMELTSFEGLVAVGLFAVYLVVLAGIKPRQWRVVWLVPAVWFVLSLERVRYAPFFALAAALVIADALPLSRVRGSLVEQPTPASRAQRLVFAATVCLALGLAVLVQQAGWPVPILAAGQVRPDPKIAPLELLPHLRDYLHERGEGRPIFNDANFGGFLLYYVPAFQIYMDDRCELYGDDWLRRYHRFITEQPERIEDSARFYGFELALVQRHSAMERYLQQAPAWRSVAQTEYASLYRRRE